MKRACTMDPANETPNKVVLVERNIMPQGIHLLDPTAVAKASKEDLVALALEIQKADSYVKATAYSKLQVIAEQMKMLKQQAKTILQESQLHMNLHHAACNFVKQPGHVYHRYQRESGQFYLSMLSPEEWGPPGPPHKYHGSFRLEKNQSWTSVKAGNAKDSIEVLDKLFPDAATTALLQSLIGKED